MNVTTRILIPDNDNEFWVDDHIFYYEGFDEANDNWVLSDDPDVPF